MADAPETPEPTPQERVIYRDEAAFRRALDQAADRIRSTQRGPDIIGMVVWWGLVAALAVLYVSDWAFGSGLRWKIIPPLDMVKPIWLLIIILGLWWFISVRRRHRRILARRLCLHCGHSLLAANTDDRGDGVCSECDQPFNLGQYRPPTENRGREFQGYLDRDHFDRMMYAAAERVRRNFGHAEGELIGLAWLTIGALVLLRLVTGWNFFEFTLGWIPVRPAAVSAVAIAGIWSGWYAWRIQRTRPRIEAQRLCMSCGYSLLRTPTSEQGIGRCPECGEVFTLAQYVRPADE